ncbi:unnamed protein product [Prorocentrum cordatum]|uniref:Uncharacterized protein n=1 Tax=Prorocentrum cordatum TaxID=2364126 RepID=A0ABN9TEV0_9DINO|nr:unnamed protein product [Polarella glacialis]
MDSEKVRLDANGMLRDKLPLRHSLRVPLIATFRARGQVWGVTPSALLTAGAATSVGGLRRSYKIGGLPQWNAEWRRSFPEGLGVSLEHWAKLLIRLAEDGSVLASSGSIAYSLEVGVYGAPPPEDATVQNALGKRVLRAYDLRSHGPVGLLAGGVVDYLQEEGLSDVGVSSRVYACQLLLFVATEMLKPCKWPVDSEVPEAPWQDCATDFSEVWPQVLPSGGGIPAPGTPNFLTEMCTSLDEATDILQIVGKVLEFVDAKLNGDRKCDDHGFRAPEHCKATFSYDGRELSGCVREKFEFPDISKKPRGAPGGARSRGGRTGTARGASAQGAQGWPPSEAWPRRSALGAPLQRIGKPPLWGYGFHPGSGGEELQRRGRTSEN